MSLRADLLSNNPFIPEGWVAPSLATPAAPKIEPPVNLELKGVDEWNGTRSFYLFDKVKLVGHWVALNDPSADTPVVSYDDSGESPVVSVRVNGETKRLTLKKSDGKPVEIKSLASAPVAPPAPPPVAPAPNGAPGNAPGGPGGFDRSQIQGYNTSLPGNDPANVAAMQAYIEKRRAERAAQPGATPAPVQPQATTPAPAATNEKPDNPQRRPLLNENEGRGRGRGR